MYKVMNKQPFPHPVENFCGKAEKYALKGADYNFDEKNNFPKNILTQDIGVTYRRRWPRR